MPSKPSLVLAKSDTIHGIKLLKARIAEVDAFNPEGISHYQAPELKALRISIDNTLISIFGKNTPEYELYRSAASLNTINGVLKGITWKTFFPLFGGTNIDAMLREEKRESIIILQKAVQALEEKIPFPLKKSLSDAHRRSVLSKLKHKVFIVHGHDDAARESVARFIEKLGFEAIILHEQANQGRTIIEKVEAKGDVRFAVVLLTPDDEGCAKGGTPQPRARQNVLLELGYFIGRLGRTNVCALKRGNVEIPSDFAGVVYTLFDDSGDWKQALGRELQEAGFEIDWNKVLK